MLVLILIGTAALARPEGIVRVIDADTWDVGNVRVRLHGLDAPEQDQSCVDPQGRKWACGAWATRQVAARFGGRHATCDAVETDRYGRTVARCMIGGADAGAQIVGSGFAFAFRRYSHAYVGAERAAAARRAGLWANDVQSPAAFRAARAARSVSEPPAAGCFIKGNISGNGRIYHMPEQRFYERTSIRTAQGERWFCTEAEARAAGWRRAKR